MTDTLVLDDGTTLYAYWVCVDCYMAHHYGFRTVCEHCGRSIESIDGAWIDPEATGDDSVWRETCDEHDTFEARHEPQYFAGDTDTPSDREPLGMMPEGARVSDWVRESDNDPSEDGMQDFSWSQCEGCGSTLGGSRYRLASDK